MATAQTPGRRRRSEAKRAAILEAAEALFVADGYELTAVDAIAARAGVSKRTLYDHFGDKETVFRGVLARVHDALVATVGRALDEELTDGRDLREALTAFATRVATDALPSSDYAAFRRLTTTTRPAPRLPEAERDLPERMLEERLAGLVARGELRPVDPRRAAQHLTVLTITLALDALHAGGPVATVIDDGVDVFVRAYARTEE